MSDPIVLVGLGLLLVLVLFARRVENGLITLPVLCLVIGLIVDLVSDHRLDREALPLELIAEVTLAIVLFSDASHLKIGNLGKEYGLPLRMLVFGIPLAALIAVPVIWLAFPQFPLWVAVLLAALLTPTDAALGAAIFNNMTIPQKLRDSLLAESGLNDGMALPIIIFAACAAVGGEHELTQDNWLVFAAKQIGFGLVLGAATGWIGGKLVVVALARQWAKQSHVALASLLIVAIAYFSADAVGGNSFVSVFVAGLFFGRAVGSHATETKHFLEDEGLGLTMVSFVFIGLFLVPEAVAQAGWQEWLLALLALFVIRPVAIGLSLLGTKTKLREKLFLGWFGPRGLATALFGLFVVSEFDRLAEGEAILSILAITVLLSAVLHGVSAKFAGAFLGTDKNA